MKEVQLVGITTEDNLVSDERDMRYTSVFGTQRVCNEYEWIQETPLTLSAEVHKIRKDGHEFYVAVKPEVWEYLYLLDNPVTAESQATKIGDLMMERSEARAKARYWEGETDKQGDTLVRVSKAGFFTRLRWLFTGVDVRRRT